METCGSTCVESICIPSYNGHQVKEMSSSTHEHAIKARKPYTITKQRERWSEEEHEKFLEALKLYGRAWRQIEEHIGTKTAVQIRSHAQKFFSKVAHDSAAAGSAAGSASVEAIVIPPPRPKRKPVHPYPRKIGLPHNLKMSIPEQAEWSYAPIPSPLERENRSPTSVLAAFPSDTAGSSVSNLPSGPTSPLSSRAGSNHVEMFNGGENHSQLPVASSEEEDGSPSPGLNNATMESDMGVEEDSSMETHAEVTTLKLFGRTVLVTDSQKHSWSDGASLQRPRPSGAIDIQSHHRITDISPQTEAQAPSILQKIDGDVSRFPGQSAWIPWNGQIIPMVYCSPCGDSASATDRPFGSCANSVPWCWALYGASQFEFPNGQSMSYSQDPCAQQRGSCNESALPSSLTEPAPPTSLRHSVNSAFSSFPTGVSKPPRGFKPYKRCLSQKVVQNLSTDLAGDSEAIELCL